MSSLYIALEAFLLLLFVLLFIKFYKTIQVVNVDDLTNTYNRKHFFDTLKKEIEKTKRQSNHLSFCMIDIDDFKTINDKFGHFVGDNILEEFANIVLDDIREYDTFARLGGEEFALLIIDNNKDYALEVCERIRKKIESNTFSTGVKLTISIGIANWEENDNIDTLYEKADKAMYESKVEGKNTTTLCKSGIINTDGFVKACTED